MYKSTIAALTLMGMVSAQSSVVDLYLIGMDNSNNIVGSVIASDKTATTYSVTCKSTASTAAATTTAFLDDSDYGCSIPPSFTFTQGPSTVHFTYAYSDSGSDSAYSTYSASADSASESIVVGCVITDSSSGVCSITDIGNYGVSSFSSVETSSFDDATSFLSPIPVTITAGALASAPNGASATATATGSSSGSKSTGASSSASGSSGASGASASKASATGSSSTSASTGGMPMVTAKAQWVIGAAAAIAYAAM
ncbi:GPI anchored protein [Rutstroemia sp. NJR-2017a BVV2]|nr:GPI anchored protein [Rutstroemia sp. NJR-2017a BVV2]